MTGTRTEQSVWESPVKVSLVNREEIQKNHASNAYEAIKNILGLDFKRPRGKEGQSAVIQGVSANRVLVLIDGEPVSASTGSTVDLTQISTVQIERVEVVKGAVLAAKLLVASLTLLPENLKKVYKQVFQWMWAAGVKRMLMMVNTLCRSSVTMPC